MTIITFALLILVIVHQGLHHPAVVEEGASIVVVRAVATRCPRIVDSAALYFFSRNRGLRKCLLMLFPFSRRSLW